MIQTLQIFFITFNKGIIGDDFIVPSQAPHPQEDNRALA